MKKKPALRFAKNTVIFSWLVSYILIILFVCVFAAIAYGKAFSYALTEVENVYRQELGRLAVSIDRSLLEMRRIGMELSMDTDVDYLLNTDTVGVDERLGFYSLQKRLNNYSVTNPNITDIGVGFRNLDYVVSNRATYSVDYYIDEIGGGDNMWEIINGSRTDGFFVVNTGSAAPSVGYLLNLPLEANSLHTSFIQVKLSSVALSSIVVDSTDRLLIVEIGSQQLHLGDESLLEASPGSCTDISYPSEFAGIRYSLLINNRALRQNIAQVNLITTLCVLACIGICSFTLVYFIRKNYSPVNRLLRTVDISFDHLPQNYKNEFDFIQQKLSVIQDKNEALSLAVDQTNRFRREAAVTQLLMGDIDAAKAGQVLLLFPAAKAGFGTVVVSPIDWQKLFHQKGSSPEDNFGLLKYIVNNIMGDFASDEMQVYGTTIDGMFVTLLCGDPAAIKAAYTRSEDYPSILSAAFGADIQIGFSDISADADSIAELYSQAREAAEFCRIFDKPFQYFRSDRSTSLSYAEYASKMMQANKNFRSALARGDFAQASQWIQELMALCFDEQQSIQDVQASMRALSTIFCGGLAEYKANYQLDKPDIDKIAAELMQCSTANHFNQVLLANLDTLKAMEIARNSEEKAQLKEELLSYIDENCTRYDLTVSSMSSHFNMTVSALSQKFKRITGMGVLEYITASKIRKAKELLQTRQYTITQVAEMVGYNDASTFIRNFKKVENISPGRYLSSLEKEDS